MQELKKIFAPNLNNKVVTDLEFFRSMLLKNNKTVKKFLKTADKRTLLNILPFVVADIDLEELFLSMTKEDFIFFVFCSKEIVDFIFLLNYMNEELKLVSFLKKVIDKFYLKEEFSDYEYEKINFIIKDYVLASCFFSFIIDNGKINNDIFLCGLLETFVFYYDNTSKCLASKENYNFVSYFINKINQNNTYKKQLYYKVFTEFFDCLTEENQNTFIKTLINDGQNDFILKIATQKSKQIKNKKIRNDFFAIKLSGCNLFNSKERNNEKQF
jgi:hypothetical protein